MPGDSSPVGLPAGTPTSIHEQHNAGEIYRHCQDSRHEWKGELRAVGFKDGSSHGGHGVCVAEKTSILP